MVKRWIFILWSMAIPAVGFAHDVKVDGLYYNLNDEQKTAQVTFKGKSPGNKDNDYSGVITIPPTITSRGHIYTVTEIGDNAFETCSRITSVTIPHSVTKIGYYAFYECSSLSSLSISPAVTVIGSYAFVRCTALRAINIPPSVWLIGGSAFFGCTNLYSISLPASVTDVGVLAFSHCTRLTSVTIDNPAIKIGENAFYDCPQLTAIRVPSACARRFKAMGTLSGLTIVEQDADVTTNTATSTPVPSSHIDPSIASSSSPSTTNPAILSYVHQSLQLIEENANQAIDANEQCKIRFQITNTGQRNAINCEAKIHGSGSTDGIRIFHIKLPVIAPGKTFTVDMPVSATAQTVDGLATFTIDVTEPNGLGIDPIQMTVATKAPERPFLQIVDYTINGQNSTLIKKKTTFELRLMMQNTQKGEAKDVLLKISLPQGVSLLDGEEQLSFPSMKGGERQTASYQLILSNKYAASTLPILVSIKESKGKYAEDKTIVLRIDPTGSSDPTNITLQDQSGDSITIGALQRGENQFSYSSPAPTVSNNTLSAITILTPFSYIPFSSVLTSYNNEFVSFEMRDRDDSFPFTLIRVKLKGDGNKVRLAKNTLQLYLGQMNQTEKIVTSYENQILFLIPKRVRTIYLTCGDGCEQQLIYSGQLEGNGIYEGTVEIK